MPWQAWRRVTVGKSCDYCLVLATRGAVYRSEATASASGHSHCDCRMEAEVNFDARQDVKIDPEDANRTVSIWNRPRNKGGGRYTYDLTTYTRQGVRPPPTRRHLAPVRAGQAPPLSPQVARVVTARAQLDSYLTTISRGGGTPWLYDKVRALKAELTAVDALAA